jgi:hypothetical protein
MLSLGDLSGDLLRSSLRCLSREEGLKEQGLQLVHACEVVNRLDSGLFQHLGFRFKLRNGNDIELSCQTRNLLKHADLVFLKLNFRQR